jgi:long-subunit fatty acid transport protein
MFTRTGGVLLAALLLGASASAQQGAVVFTRTGSGARAAGMANAFIAVSDDGTAASWNPAGLGQLRKPELSFVSTTLGQAVRVQGFRTLDDLSAFTTARSSYRSTDLDFASLAVPATLWRKPTTFQGSWRRYYPLDYREIVSMNREPLAAGAPPAARIESNSDILGSVDVVSLAAAVKLTPRLSLGASYNLWRGHWKEDDAAVEIPLEGEGLPVFFNASQSSRIRGDSFSLGLMLTYPRWSLGLLHQTALRSDFETQARVTGSAAPPESTPLVEGELRFPRAWGVGGAWRPAARWTVALDLSWDNWRDAEIDTPVTGRVSLFDGLPRDRTSTRDTLSVNAGAEHVFTGEGFLVPLRFGVAWEPQGARSPYTLDPVNYRMLAVGTGYNTNRLKFDAALQFRWASFRDGANFGAPLVGSLSLPLAVGERNAREWRLKLSLILRVTDTDKLRGTIRKMFGGGGS